MPGREKFVPVDADLRPGHAGDEFARSARRGRGTRARMAERGSFSRQTITGSQRRILLFTWLGLIFMAIYAVTIGLALFQPGYSFADRIASGFLLFGLLFIVAHGAGYANSMIKALWGYKETKTRLFVSSSAPSVVCIIASFNEPPDVLEETVAAMMALDYPGKKVVLLDDSTKEENRRAAREIAEKYGAQCIQRTNRRGYKAGAINDYLEQTDAEYLAIFDADALPTPKFLKEVIPVIDENPTLAFVQTPQFYANTNVSYVALASARQQNVFYEYICEGKSYSRAAFCCGTNVIFRKKALVDVGGFDETNVTEDFATSFKMHYKGWDSLYFNRTYVYSLAPENLAAYFTQQSRWSFGSMGVLRSFIGPFLKNPRAMRAGQWYEYFLSTTYYYVGIVYTVFMLLPLLYIFFGIKPLRQDVFTYLAVFVPYFVFTLNMFYAGMEARGYPLNQMILGQQIGFVSFPIHLSSAISALLNKKRPFALTPKGVSGRVPWQSLWAQFLMMGLSLFGFCWGMYRYMAGYDRNTTAIVINSFWAIYHVWMLSAIFKLNQPVRSGSSAKSFFVNERAPGPASLSPLEGMRSPLTWGRFATGVGLLCLLAIGFVGWNVFSWNWAPVYPVNLYLVDRTVGRDNQEHKSLFWTLNFLKVQKQPQFGPSGGGNHTNYDLNYDYYGFVANPKATPVPDQTKQGDLVEIGLDRPLPSRLTPPGAMYLVDTYGEFVEFDPKLGRYVRYRASRRGIGADEIDRIEAFSRRGGLLLGEWNTLSYPTRPGAYIPEKQMDAAITAARSNRDLLEHETLPSAQKSLDVARYQNNSPAMQKARGRLADIRGQITDAEYKLRSLQSRSLYNRLEARQGEACKRLEGLLHVSYAGWYGRFVDNFADEKEYDYRLWKNVRDYLTAQNGGKVTEPSGPGFVFYPDGPSTVYNESTKSLEPSPFAKPVAILGSELGSSLTGELAMIVKTHDEKLLDDPLLRGVSSAVPCRYWFDIVNPAPGARVLASYELQITPTAAQRLKDAGFPTNNLSPDGTKVIFPATVAWRDTGASNGELRSLYFAGDASDYAVIADIAQRFPALGGVDKSVGGRFGSYSSQYFWGYYEPILHNVFDSTPRIRYQQ